MKKKRFLAVVMAVLMALTLIPSMVFAAEPSGELGGKLKVKGLAAVGTALTADYTKVTPEGVTDTDVSFLWSRQTNEKELVELGTEKTYTVTEEDLGYLLVLEVSALEGSGLTGKLTAKTLEVTATEEEAKLLAEQHKQKETLEELDAEELNVDELEIVNTEELNTEGSNLEELDPEVLNEEALNTEVLDAEETEELQEAEAPGQVPPASEKNSQDVEQTDMSEEGSSEDTLNTEDSGMHIYTESELMPDGTEQTTYNAQGDEQQSAEVLYDARVLLDGDAQVCDFGIIEVGTEEMQAQFAQITNTGNADLNFQPISPEHFMVADIEQPLAPGESVSVWIQPREGIEAGEYADTITYQTEEGLEISFDAKVIVEEEELFPAEEPMEDLIEEPMEDIGNVGEELTGTEPIEEPTITIAVEADPTEIIYEDLEVGYDTPEATEVTVTNTGDDTVTLLQPVSEYFDLGELSATELAPGESAVFTAVPKVGLEAGTYEETITVMINDSTGEEAEGVSVLAQITVAEKEILVYELSADPTDHDFGKVEAGYSEAPKSKKVTITNEGNTTVVLNTPQSTSFKFGKLSATELAPGESCSFKIRPKDGLPEGSYMETIVIPNEQQISLMINVQFTVTAQTVKLTGIQAPASVEGVKNGAEKTAKALGLPGSVVINTTQGDKKAKVQWNVSECDYDPTVKTEQSFKIKGSVTLPDGVQNPDEISLITAVKVTVKAGRTAKIADPADNKIIGIQEDGYTTRSKITFTAVGAGMENESPGTDDVRYVPYKWKVINTNSWSAAPYTAAFGITKAGTYNLTVLFNRQRYNGSEWENTGEQDTKQVSFKISQAQTITATPTPQPKGAAQKSAVRTGDTTQILPFVVILVIAAGAIVGTVIYKKRK